MVELEIEDIIYILDKLKFAWVCIPKCASNSIASGINKVIYSLLSSNKNIRLYNNDSKKKLLDHPDYFKFVFVRNPYDRLVSCYCNRFSDKFYRGSYGIKSTNPEEFKAMGLYKAMSFNEFLSVVCEQDDDNSDRHWRSCNHSCFIDDKILVDFVGKVENINKGWKVVCEVMNWKYTELPQLKTSERTHYRNYYTPTTQKLVEKRFEKDLDIFKYTY